MADTVLVPFDGSPLSERALEYAMETFPEASIAAIYVVNPSEAVMEVEAGGLPLADDWYDRARERADAVLGSASRLAGERGVDLATATEVGRPSRAILEYAADNEVDQIVMGSHGRSGIERVVLGSVAERVVRRADVPVTVVR